MANNVYRATDAVLVLDVEDTPFPTGDCADGQTSEYDLRNAVGHLHNVTILVSSDLKPFYEIGRSFSDRLRPGIVHVAGSAERAHVNGALMRQRLGDGAVSPPEAANVGQPSFNIVATLRDPARPDQQSQVTVLGVKFDTWFYNAPLDDFVLESVTFQALRFALCA